MFGFVKKCELSELERRLREAELRLNKLEHSGQYTIALKQVDSDYWPRRQLAEVVQAIVTHLGLSLEVKYSVPEHIVVKSDKKKK